MVLELLALVLWIPIAVLGLWLLATGRRVLGLPKNLKQGWQLRVYGLIYVLLPMYPIYRAVHDGNYALDGIVIGYVVVVAVGMVALYRRQKARRAEVAETLS